MGGSARRSDDEIYQRVAAHFPLMSASDLQLTDAAGHTAKFRKHVEFARNLLREKGELDGSVRGVWSITNKGRDRLAREWPPSEQPDYSKKLYVGKPRYKKSTRPPAEAATPPITPQPPISGRPAPTPVPSQPPVQPPPRASLFELIQAHLKEVECRLAQRIADLSADQFEQFVAEFLVRQGYSDVRRVGGPGDRNVDVAAAYRAPSIRFPVRVQVKHRRVGPNIGPTDVAAFRDRAGGPDHTLLMVTNVEFTDGAKETASEQGRQIVHLIDGKELIRSMVDKRIGAREGPMGIPDIDEDFWGQF